MSGSRTLSLALVASAAIACEQPSDPIARPQPRLVIHAVLDVGRPFYQQVKVEYLDGTFGHRLVGVGNADVTITAPDGNVVVGAFQPNGPQGLYLVDAGVDQPPLVSGGTYMLRVHTPVGDVTGTTTIPSVNRFDHDVFQTFNRDSDTLRLSWSRVSGAKAYEVAIDSRWRDESGYDKVRHYAQFADTSIVIPGNTRSLNDNAVFVANGSAEVAVSAVDDNYYTYYHAISDPFAGAPTSRLIGGEGVFGSIARVRDISYLRVESGEPGHAVMKAP